MMIPWCQIYIFYRLKYFWKAKENHWSTPNFIEKPFLKNIIIWLPNFHEPCPFSKSLKSLWCTPRWISKVWEYILFYLSFFFSFSIKRVTTIILEAGSFYGVELLYPTLIYSLLSIFFCKSKLLLDCFFK